MWTFTESTVDLDQAFLYTKPKPMKIILNRRDDSCNHVTQEFGYSLFITSTLDAITTYGDRLEDEKMNLQEI